MVGQGRASGSSRRFKRTLQLLEALNTSRLPYQRGRYVISDLEGIQAVPALKSICDRSRIIPALHRVKNLPINVQDSHINVVEIPIVRVESNPLQCAHTPPRPHLLFPCSALVSVVPHACIFSNVRLHGLLYFSAINCSVSTHSASRPSPTRNLGVSFSRMTVIRKMDMTKTSEPEAYQT